MKIGEVVKSKQPKEYEKINKQKKKRKRRRKENLSFNDFENMMRHDSYERHKGALRSR